MTDLHAEIMNLLVNRDAMAGMGIGMRVAYKVGHRDARHAAAELAVCHSASLADARAEIARLRGALGAEFPVTPNDWFDSEQEKRESDEYFRGVADALAFVRGQALK